MERGVQVPSEKDRVWYSGICTKTRAIFAEMPEIDDLFSRAPTNLFPDFVSLCMICH